MYKVFELRPKYSKGFFKMMYTNFAEDDMKIKENQTDMVDSKESIRLDSLVEETCEGDLELAVELIESFLETYEAQLDLISEAIEQIDMASLGTAAHKFKGTLLTFGVDRAAELANELEEVGRAGKQSDPEMLQDQLVHELKETVLVMNDFLKANSDITIGE
jgi:HPt (histidine-containing phosphotransfer) domain-containing protein